MLKITVASVNSPTAYLSPRERKTSLLPLHCKRLLLAFAFFLSIGAALSQAAITRLKDIWELQSGPNADEVHNVDITAKVLIDDVYWNHLWLQDDNGKIVFFPASASDPIPVTAGESYHIQGTMIPSQGIAASQVSVTPIPSIYNNAPSPVPNNFENIRDLHETWVRLDGYIDEVIVHDERHSEFRVIVGDHRIDCAVYNEKMEPLTVNPGEFASFEGIFTITENHATHSLGYSLLSNSPHFATPIDTETNRYFEVPNTPIGEIAHLPENTKTRINGIVYSQEPGKYIIVSDETGSLKLASCQLRHFEPGTSVEVVGLRASTNFLPVLKQPIVRPLSISIEQSKLHLIEQIYELSSSSFDTAHPPIAKVSGVITFFSPDGQYSFLTDATGTMAVELAPNHHNHINFASAVSLTGQVAETASVRHLKATQMAAAGRVDLPDARPSNFEEANAGFDDFQWVEIHGNLRSSRVSDDWLLIDFTVPRGEFQAKIPVQAGTTPNFDLTPGSSLKVRGILIPDRRDDGSLSGFSLLVPNLDQISVNFRAPDNPFENQAYPLSSLYKSRAPYLSQRPVSVSGIVTHSANDGSLVITDGDYSLNVLPLAYTGAQQGDEVQVVGLPGRYGSRVTIKDAQYRVMGKGAPQEPTELETTDWIDTRLDLKLVTVSGSLIDIASTTDGPLLTVENNDSTLEIRISSSALDETTNSWKPGSHVKTTGIYNITYDALGMPEGFYIEIRTPNDLIVIQPPAWWTPERLRITALASVVILLLGAGWSVTLRSKISTQTDLIREKITKEAHLETVNQQIIENASDFIFTLDMEGQFSTFNPTGEKITGYTKEEVHSISIYSLLEKRDRHLVRMGLRRKKSKGEYISITNLITKKNGDRLWVETRFRFIRENGNAVGVLGVMRDISERKQIEFELTNAKETAEANTRSKSAFLATMSHELRTPMNGVIGMANILSDSDLTDEQRSYADTIRDSAETLLSILNDILDFSKAEAGKLTLSPQEIDVNDTIKQSLSLMQSNASAKGIGLEFTPSETLPSALLCDGSRLRQVLLNIVSNAIKFTEVGKVSVASRFLDQDDKTATICIEVVDTGIGIPKNAIPRLFNPFEQADGTHSRRFGGTGLGLSICRQIVELMGGTIGVRSEPGGGSEFWFTLVLQKIEGVEKPPAKNAESAKAKPKWEGPSLKVLIVEDTPVNQRVTKLQLKRLGLEADIANNGIEALEAVENAHYDVILMDCQMPEMDGFEATRRLRLDDRYKHIPIVALTANAMDSDKKRCSEAGMDDFVSKPTKPAALLAALNRVRSETEANRS